jgi:hypothetical protein
VQRIEGIGSYQGSQRQQAQEKKSSDHVRYPSRSLYIAARR